MIEHLTPEENQIKQEAIDYAKATRNQLVNDILSGSGCAHEKQPLVMFMAGAPGAGKTEVSQIVTSIFNKNRTPKVLRVDPDEFRSHFPSYTGDNSHLFQMAVVKVVEKLLDKLLHKKYSFILDGTFSSPVVARKNVARAINKGYQVTVTYVYQPPEVSWHFVCAREIKEGRRIKKEIFAEQYLSSISTVNQIKKEFGTNVQLDVLIRNFNNSKETKVLLDQEKIAETSLAKYTHSQLMSLL